jgi:hypothetical protein
MNPEVRQKILAMLREFLSLSPDRERYTIVHEHNEALQPHLLCDGEVVLGLTARLESLRASSRASSGPVKVLEDVRPAVEVAQ